MTTKNNINISWSHNFHLKIPLDINYNLGIIRHTTNKKPQHNLSKIIIHKHLEHFIANPSVKITDYEEDNYDDPEQEEGNMWYKHLTKNVLPITQEPEISTNDPTQDLLRWHYRLVHEPFK